MSSCLFPFAPENLVSRDGFGNHPIPRQPAHLHTQVESGAHEIPPEFHGGVHLLSVHIMYYECSSKYIYVHTLYDDISSTVMMFRTVLY